MGFLVYPPLEKFESFYIGFYGDSPALSAVRTPEKPAAPVYLLHGLADNVIPAAESAHLAAYLRGDPWFDGPAWDAARVAPPGVQRTPKV